MADARVTQAGVLSAAQGDGGDVRVTQAGSMVAGYDVNDIRVTQAGVFVAVTDAAGNPRLRCWTYSLDGHDFYVLSLGEETTLVYDLHSQQWSVFGNEANRFWRAAQGINWLDAGRNRSLYGSSIVCGDYLNGALYFLDPTYERDDSASLGSDDPRPFTRVLQAAAPNPSYDYRACFSIQTEGSVGKALEEGLQTVELLFSDDRGVSYVSAGEVTLPQGEYHTRLSWRSLGSFQSPGRIFKLVDEGALSRIDYIMMDAADAPTES